MVLAITLPIWGEVDTELLMAEVGLFVSGLSCMTGMWIERDRERPVRYTVMVSVLIGLATAVSMYQAISQAEDAAKQQADMAAMLAKIDKLMQASNVQLPGLQDLMKNELAAQSRDNPKVIQQIAQRVSDEGGDPARMLSDYLPASDVQQLKRVGDLNVQPTDVPRRSEPAGTLAASTHEPATPAAGGPRAQTPPDSGLVAGPVTVDAGALADAGPVGTVDAGATVPIDAGAPVVIVDAGPPVVTVAAAPPPTRTAAAPAEARKRARDPYDEAESERKHRH